MIRQANDAGMLLVSFDNIGNNPDHLIVDMDHGDVREIKAEVLLEDLAEAGVTEGKVLWVRGLQGNAAEFMQHDGFICVTDTSPFDVVEVI